MPKQTTAAKDESSFSALQLKFNKSQHKTNSEIIALFKDVIYRLEVIQSDYAALEKRVRELETYQKNVQRGAMELLKRKQGEL